MFTPESQQNFWHYQKGIMAIGPNIQPLMNTNHGAFFPKNKNSFSKKFCRQRTFREGNVSICIGFSDSRRPQKRSKELHVGSVLLRKWARRKWLWPSRWERVCTTYKITPRTRTDAHSHYPISNNSRREKILYWYWYCHNTDNSPRKGAITTWK